MIDEKKLFEKVGSMDGKRLLDFFNQNNITDIEIVDDEITFKNSITFSLNKLQSILTTLSLSGRAFPLTVKDDALYINVVIAAKSNLYRPSLGHLEEDILLPSIEPGSCVLDIGAGSGYAAKKMKDDYECDVYALEPCDEKSTDYDSCVSKLGAGFCRK